ncbi:MAG: hypothetical protein O9256_03430 [Rhizobiaceae bacterium]|nr:hypothetical protein [Rhizobiaceae bacterium]MCZ8352644.1 hypothetical protein [Rhizobium sp.]
MTEDEAEAAYQDLLKILRDRRSAVQPSSRDDFLPAIETEIALGKPVTVSIKVKEEKTSDPVAGDRGVTSPGKAEFIGRDEYSGREKLKILLDGLELATLAPTKMAVTIIVKLSSLSEKDTWKSMDFGDDQTSNPTRSIVSDDIAGATRSIETLRKLVAELRSELATTGS